MDDKFNESTLAKTILKIARLQLDLTSKVADLEVVFQALSDTFLLFYCK